MTDPSALFGLISGLGGALIGAAGGIYADRRRRKDERSASVQLDEKESLEAIARARLACRNWLTVTTQIAQSMAYASPMSLESYDEAMNPALEAVTESVYGLARSGMPLQASLGRFTREQHPSEGRSAVREIHLIADDLRAKVLSGNQISSEVASRIAAVADHAAMRLSEYLSHAAAHFVGDLGAVASAPGGYGRPPSNLLASYGPPGENVQSPRNED